MTDDTRDGKRPILSRFRRLVPRFDDGGPNTQLATTDEMDAVEADLNAAFARMEKGAPVTETQPPASPPIVEPPPTEVPEPPKMGLPEPPELDLPPDSEFFEFQELFRLQTAQLDKLNEMNRRSMDDLASFMERLGLADLAYQRENIKNLLASVRMPQAPDSASTPESPAVPQ